MSDKTQLDVLGRRGGRGRVLGKSVSPQWLQDRILLGTGAKLPEIFLTRFELPRLVLRVTFFIRFIQRIALVNTLLPSIWILISSFVLFMLNEEDISRQ